MRRFFYILSASVAAMALGLWLGNAFAQDTANRDLKSRAENAAEIWLNHLEEYEISLLTVLDGNPAANTTMEEIERLARAENVFDFKIFDKFGRPVLALTGEENMRPDRDTAYDPMEDSQPLNVLATGRSVTELVTHSTKPGYPRHFAEIYRPILREGRVVGVYEVYMDITRAAEDTQQLYRQVVLSVGLLIAALMLIPFAVGLVFWFQLKTTARNLDQARQQAEEAERIKSAFLANMSHEIRTPMNGVIAMSELLEQSELTMEQRSMTSTITSSAVALLAIINDILDFSKIEAGKMTVRPEPFDLLGLIEEVATLFSPAAAARSVEVCVESVLDPPLYVRGDSARLRQCLLNVVGNAVKFTPAGHVHIWLNRTDDGQIAIKITDTGVGIPEDKLDHVFEEFSQIDNTDTRRFEGTGLGLAITLRLVRLMGGTMTARSRAGAGSVFEMRLPMPAVPPPPAELTFWREALAGLVGARVLVVEDLDVTRSALRTMLAGLGAKPATARTGQDALDLFETYRRQGTPFDIGLIDCGLPDTSGDKLLQALKTRYGDATPPFVLMLRADRELTNDALRQIGFIAALRKPLILEQFTRVLSGALGHDLDRQDRSDHSLPQMSALEGKFVLLAEDNATNQLVIRKLLARSGLRLEVARNGQEAVDMYSRLGPDLVLMDVSMPVMNGYDATRHIRTIEARGARNAVPIVALTANAMAEDRTTCMDAGMSDFLSKPVRRAELLAMLAKWLNEEPAARRA